MALHALARPPLEYWFTAWVHREVAAVSLAGVPHPLGQRMTPEMPLEVFSQVVLTDPLGDRGSDTCDGRHCEALECLCCSGCLRRHKRGSVSWQLCLNSHSLSPNRIRSKVETWLACDVQTDPRSSPPAWFPAGVGTVGAKVV